MRRNCLSVLILAGSCFFAASVPVWAQSPEDVRPGKPIRMQPARRRPQSDLPVPHDNLDALPEAAPLPDLSNATNAPDIESAAPAKTDQTLPINLATAMCLADARPLVIEAARASELTEFGRWEKAQVLWLPDIYLGSDYQRHDGGQERTTGEVAINDRNQFLTGMGLKAIFGLTDAIYQPLAAQQVFRARNLQVQTAKNDALLAVTDAYFSVQQARGILAGYDDAVAKAKDLVTTVESLSQGLAAPIEVQRAQTTLAELQQADELARRDWRFYSANLTRVLRLNPAAVVIPMEPPHLKVTVVPPDQPLDELIPEGLRSRPELAAQQALVKATTERLKQEKMRPLIPSLVAQGAANPGDTLGAGYYEANLAGNNPTWTGRSDWDFQVVWQLQNLGAGNTGLVHERRGEERQATVELFRIQDQVAAEVTQAFADVEAATARVQQAEYGLAAAEVSFTGNLKGLSETIRTGETLQLVIRPQEVSAALLQLRQAYANYYTSVNDFNRAEFRLFHALGYPAQQLTCNKAWGDPEPIDCVQPPHMASALSTSPGTFKPMLRR